MGREAAGTTARELGKSLQIAAQRYLDWCHSHAWEPAEGSGAQERWTHAVNGDLVAKTVMEADGLGAALMLSAAQHAIVLAGAITQGRAVVTHTIGRTVFEHGLRALHLLDHEAQDDERAIRRLSEWLYAIDEAQWLHDDLVKYQHPGAERGTTHDEVRERVRRRAEALGVTLGGDPLRVTGHKRLSTMALGEKHLTWAGGQGMPSTLLRWGAAADHGVETGLLRSVQAVGDTFGPYRALPGPLPVAYLAYDLQGVMLVLINGMHSLGRCLDWPDSAASERAVVAASRMHDVWEQAVREYLDQVAPDRPRTGIFAERSIRPDSSAED